MCVCVSICLFIYLSSISLCIYLSNYLPIYLTTYLPLNQSIDLSIYLSLYLYPSLNKPRIILNVIFTLLSYRLPTDRPTCWPTYLAYLPSLYLLLVSVVHMHCESSSAPFTRLNVHSKGQALQDSGHLWAWYDYLIWMKTFNMDTEQHPKEIKGNAVWRKQGGKKTVGKEGQDGEDARCEDVTQTHVHTVVFTNRRS